MDQFDRQQLDLALTTAHGLANLIHGVRSGPESPLEPFEIEAMYDALEGLKRVRAALRSSMAIEDVISLPVCDSSRADRP